MHALHNYFTVHLWEKKLPVTEKKILGLEFLRNNKYFSILYDSKISGNKTNAYMHVKAHICSTQNRSYVYLYLLLLTSVLLIRMGITLHKPSSQLTSIKFWFISSLQAKWNARDFLQKLQLPYFEHKETKHENPPSCM